MVNNNGKKGYKYDWKAIEKLYYKEYKVNFNARDFAKKYNIPYGTLTPRLNKWNKKKKAIEEKGESKTIDMASDAIAKANVKHLQESYLIRDWAHKNLFTKDEQGNIVYKIEAKTAKDVIDAIKVSVDMERDALGLNKKEITVTFQTVNVMFGEFATKIITVIKDVITNDKDLTRISDGITKLLAESNKSDFEARKEIVSA